MAKKLMEGLEYKKFDKITVLLYSLYPHHTRFL